MSHHRSPNTPPQHPEAPLRPPEPTLTPCRSTIATPMQAAHSPGAVDYGRRGAAPRLLRPSAPPEQEPGYCPKKGAAGGKRSVPRRRGGNTRAEAPRNP